MESERPCCVPGGRIQQYRASYAWATALYVFLGASVADAEAPRFSVPGEVEELFDIHCYVCHEAGMEKGDIRLDNLHELELANRLELLNKMQEQVYLGAMPKDEKIESKDADALLKWMSGALAEHNASKLEDKLRYYKYANSISHEKLFSGEINEMPYTPGRRWKINEYIYAERIADMYRVNHRHRDRKSDYKGNTMLPVGYVQPFSMPKESGVLYYDIDVVGGGEFLTLLDNAKYTVDRMLLNAVEKRPDFVKPTQIKNKEATVFRPNKTEAPFEKLVLGDGNPTDADLEAAISCQFQLALQREPTPEEMSEYLHFMKQAIKSSGVMPALEKMMITVLMESEFLYRSEFGGGEPDAYGRKKLTPREASYALAYALTDRVPDEALEEAARTGKLSTKQDYEREVLRMLNDDSLDKSRIIRFFRDYFGYYQVFDIFKDEVRFGGTYNPHRAARRVMQWRIPGKVTSEADALVMHILKEDRDVLKRLLTTDEYFVHHTGDHEAMAKLVEATDEAAQLIRDNYEKLDLKNNNTHQGAAQNLKAQMKSEMSKAFTGRNMTYFIRLFDPKAPDRKLIPIMDPVTHSVKMYNLDHETWSYEAKQPFKVEKRMGMLTHPAWLTAFSRNAETDIIHRGKWIQEKLLGGVIPDVPITVEAKIPEAHDQSLRQRLASVTEHKDCWGCHEKMNPLGYPFETYDDFGRYRVEEMLEHSENIIKTVKTTIDGVNPRHKFDIHTYKTLPVNPTGALNGTGDPSLDGEVNDALELIDRLSKSERVRQVFIRNVFRYFMGRNEMLSDSKTLIEADRAYVESGGSFNALVVSLLTSDSFIYRK